MRTLLLAAAVLLATPAIADTAPPPGGPGEVLIPGSAPGVTPRMMQTVMPPHVPEIAYQNMVRSSAQMALNRRDFAFLNAKAAGYRAAQSRSAFGDWELEYLYRGMTPNITGDAVKDEQIFASTEGEIQDWIRQTPNEPTPHLAYAWLLIQHAWSESHQIDAAAGPDIDGDALQARRDKAMAPTLGKARAYLEAHHDLAAADPEWYVLMEEVGRTQDWDGPAMWRVLDEATQRYPNYSPIYYRYVEYAVHTVRHFDGHALGVAVNVGVARSQATEGNQMYARLYGYVSTCGCDHGNLFRTSAATWPQMRESLEEIAQKWPDPWVYDTKFYYACQAGDRAEAVLALDKIAVLPLPSPVWHGDAAARSSCQLWAAGRQATTPFEAVPPPTVRPMTGITPAALVGVVIGHWIASAIASLVAYFAG